MFIGALGQYTTEGLEEWLDTLLQQELGLEGRPVRFLDLPWPLAVLAANLATARPRVWNSRDSGDVSVAHAVKCSCCLPAFFQPVQQNAEILVDGGLVSNLPVHLVSAMPDVEDLPVLAFRLARDEQSAEPRIESAERYLKLLVETVISGATHLQLEMGRPCQVIAINTGSHQSTNVHVKQEDVADLISRGESACRNFFDFEQQHVESSGFLAKRISNPDRKGLLEFSIDEILVAVETLAIFGGDLSWVDELSPCLLYCKKNRIQVRVLTSSPSITSQSSSARLLGRIGCEVRSMQSLSPVVGTLIDAGRPTATAILVSKTDEGKSRIATVLQSGEDHGVLQVLATQFDQMWNNATQIAPASEDLEIEVIRTDVLIDSLKRDVRQYRKAQIDYAIVDVETVRPLSRWLQGLKKARVKPFMSLLHAYSIQCFDSIWVKHTNRVIVAPIIEYRDGEYVVVDGTHRMNYCVENGISHVRALVVKGVDEQLPAVPAKSWAGVAITYRDIPRNRRYMEYEERFFRRLEIAYVRLGDRLYESGNGRH